MALPSPLTIVRSAEEIRLKTSTPATMCFNLPAKLPMAEDAFCKRSDTPDFCIRASASACSFTAVCSFSNRAVSCLCCWSMVFRAALWLRYSLDISAIWFSCLSKEARIESRRFISAGSTVRPASFWSSNARLRFWISRAAAAACARVWRRSSPSLLCFEVVEL